MKIETPIEGDRIFARVEDRRLGTQVVLHRVRSGMTKQLLNRHTLVDVAAEGRKLKYVPKEPLMQWETRCLCCKDRFRYKAFDGVKNLKTHCYVCLDEGRTEIEAKLSQSVITYTRIDTLD